MLKFQLGCSKTQAMSEIKMQLNQKIVLKYSFYLHLTPHFVLL